MMSALRRDKRLLLTLLVALVHGLLYVFIAPPWQHYDEPTHFEFAHLLANRSVADLSLPHEGDTDARARYAIAASMVEHRFFDRVPRPNLIDPSGDIWIGINQANERTLYYSLVSLPLRALRYTDLVTQLHAARLTSLWIYLLTIVFAAQLVRELTHEGNPLRWFVPLLMALIPSFVDLMTAVNDDVGVTATFTLFFVCVARIFMRGLTLRRAIALIGATLLSIATKTTGLLAAPLCVVTFLFVIARPRVAWSVMGIALIALAAASLNISGAAYWYRSSAANEIPTSDGTVGARALAVNANLVNNYSTDQLRPRQPLPLAVTQNLRGKTVTLGAWVWSSSAETVRVHSPTFADKNAGQYEYRDIAISNTPQFFAFSFPVRENVAFAAVWLVPVDSAVVGAPLTIFYDGVVLVEGDYATTQNAPAFSDTSAQSGTWAGRPFTNLVRNGSGEQRWLTMRSWADRVATAAFGSQASATFGSLMDLGTTGWYYRLAAVSLARSFWAYFGWGHVFLMQPFVYAPLLLLTLLGLIGFALRFKNRIAKSNAISHGIVAVFGLALMIVWALAWQRGIEFALFYDLFVPVARYTFPVIALTLIVLASGWQALFKWRGALATICALLVIYDVLSLARVIQFYG